MATNITKAVDSKAFKYYERLTSDKYRCIFRAIDRIFWFSIGLASLILAPNIALSFIPGL